LTEDGRAFHARARDLLAEVDDLHSMFAGDRVALRGHLRVDLPTEVARTTILPALRHKPRVGIGFFHADA
jgi:DNA-binding transcriptional LysR family regulator